MFAEIAPDAHPLRADNNPGAAASSHNGVSADCRQALGNMAVFWIDDAGLEQSLESRLIGNVLGLLLDNWGSYNPYLYTPCIEHCPGMSAALSSDWSMLSKPNNWCGASPGFAVRASCINR